MESRLAPENRSPAVVTLPHFLYNVRQGRLPMKFHRFATILLFFGIIGFGCLASAQEQQVTPAPAQAPSITIDEAILCTGVIDRVPQGVPQAAAPAEAQAAPAESQAPAAAAPAQAQTPAQAKTPAETQATPAAVEFPAGTVWLYCKVSGSAPATIKHAWYFGDKLVRTIELSIDGSPWRTWSNKTIPQEMAGAWKVEIQDAGGAVLKTLTFSIK